MQRCWMALALFLCGSACVHRDCGRVPCVVKGHPEDKHLESCGDGGIAGRLQPPQEASVSQERLVGSVAASVLLTFVVGFSAGAMSRTHVLRCLRAVGRRLAPHHRPPPPRVSHHEVMMSSLDSTVPPIKPRRSYRLNPPTQHTVYLESCDSAASAAQTGEVTRAEVTGAEEETGAEEVTGAEITGREEQTGAGEVTGAEITGTEKESGAEEVTGAEDVTGAEEMAGVREATEAEEETGTEVTGTVDMKGAKEIGVEEVMCAAEVTDAEEMAGPEEGTEMTGTEETGLDREGTEEAGTEEESGEPSDAKTSRGRRVRVIRLYQYDEEGQRYGHLPRPSLQEPRPKVKQRSLSLNHLHTIMAAATAGPLEAVQGEAPAQDSTS
ncbi:hypothetical protein NQD34_009775 [Periophthalmus magnuspinnatus]|uniref:uncharacterized protein LOC117380225 n=1 Tax=Periophthalmus magnuspinnatus TaxID=409849 RepID=UPI00145A5127|nr:uncharacterized protein LOC117380225 [Periophthalmus magnuspinnatus]KAJ0022285.1 hypothetical protein NQD34_009775 [Periophthalmus magnuspinnatus]